VPCGGACSFAATLLFLLKKITLFLPWAVSLAAFAAPETPSESLKIEALRTQVETLSQAVATLRQELRQQQKRWETFTASATTVLAPIPENREVHSSHHHHHHHHHDHDHDHPHPQPPPTAWFNPEISASVDFVTSYSRLANQWNFVLRDVELMVQSRIDQYARAYVILNAETPLIPTESSNLFEHTHVVLEEAAIATTSLPWGLELKAGQFFADFTMEGKLHAHELPFVDRPPSLQAAIGGETMARGVELSWRAPVHPYLRFTGGIVDHIGHDTPATNRLYGEAHDESDHHHHHNGATVFAERHNRPLGSLTAYGRAVTLLELAHQASLQLGLNYAQGDHGRQIGSIDAKFQWKPYATRNDLFEMGGEALWARQAGTLSEEASGHGHQERASTRAAGGYVYAQYRFGRYWQPGIRLDYTHIRGLELDEEEHPHSFTNNLLTASAYLTLYLSDANRLRLQVNYLHASRDIVPRQGRDEWQAFFQWTVILGAHRHPHLP